MYKTLITENVYLKFKICKFIYLYFLARVSREWGGYKKITRKFYYRWCCVGLFYFIHQFINNFRLYFLLCVAGCVKLDWHLSIFCILQRNIFCPTSVSCYWSSFLNFLAQNINSTFRVRMPLSVSVLLHLRIFIDFTWDFSSILFSV